MTNPYKNKALLNKTKFCGDVSKSLNKISIYIY